jgi:hypothetical protein
MWIHSTIMRISNLTNLANVANKFNNSLCSCRSFHEMADHPTQCSLTVCTNQLTSPELLVLEFSSGSVWQIQTCLQLLALIQYNWQLLWDHCAAHRCIWLARWLSTVDTNATGSIYTIMVSTNAHKYTKISLYTQWTPTCFGHRKYFGPLT